MAPTFVDELYFTNKIVVVIDVLRASSTIITALANGAKEVIPVSSVEFSMKASGNMFGGKTLRGGERNMKKIDGFNLGNSPSEYDPETVSDKSIVFLSTNGSKAIAKTRFAESAFICSFLNLRAVARHLIDLNRDFEILCAGQNGGFSLEDTICAGCLIDEVLELNNEAGLDISLRDTSKAAVTLSNAAGNNLYDTLSNTEHGQLLIENEFQKDIEDCSKLNFIETIPVFINTTIKPVVPPVKDTQEEE
jgi:2-phosphosulfolactate phosphatase